MDVNSEVNSEGMKLGDVCHSHKWYVNGRKLLKTIWITFQYHGEVFSLKFPVVLLSKPSYIVDFKYHKQCSVIHTHITVYYSKYHTPTMQIDLMTSSPTLSLTRHLSLI